jgi:hypothetical protein
LLWTDRNDAELVQQFVRIRHDHWQEGAKDHPEGG